MPASRLEEILVRRNKVMELFLQGVPQFKIAEQLNMSNSIICEDLKRIRKDWLHSQRKNYDDYINQEIAKLSLIEKEAWDAWQESKREFTEFRKKGKAGKSGKNGSNDKNDNESDSGKAVVSEITQITKRKEPNPAYLAIILQVSKRRAELLGYEGVTRTDETVTVNVNA